MITDCEFVIGNRDRLSDGEAFAHLFQSHGADYLKWFSQVSCMFAGWAKRGRSGRKRGRINDFAQNI